MPTRPKRPCAHPGCPELVDRGYCAKHQHLAQQRKADSNRHYDQNTRDQRARDFYQSRAWQAVRRQALIRDHGLCQDCLKEQRVTPAETVHHIVSVRDDWSLRLVLSNLLSLCFGCHNKRHGGKSDES